MLYRKGEGHNFGLRDVKGKTIAMMMSKPIRDTLTSAGATVHLVKDLKKAIRELSDGQYDAVICFRYQSRYLMKALGLDNLEAEDLTLMSREYCYVSNNKALIDAINEQLIVMEKEGMIEDVYGNVKTSFGGLAIPMWVWGLL